MSLLTIRYFAAVKVILLFNPNNVADLHGLQRAQSSRKFEDEVSTGSGSDRVIVLAKSTVAWIATRSLSLPVLTA